MKYNIHKTLLFTIAFFLSLTLFTGPAFAKNATLHKVKGLVNVFKTDKTEGIKGKSGMSVFVGDQIVTVGKDSLADINFPNGDIVRIMPDSKLEIKVSDFKKKTSSVRLKLFAGKIFNVVRKFTKDSIYEVETRISIAGVRGTVWSAEIIDVEKYEAFMVREEAVAAVSPETLPEEEIKVAATTPKTKPEKETTVVFMVKEGKVAAINPEAAPEEEIIVSDLKKTIVVAGKAPSKPTPLTPAEIAMFDVLNDILLEIREDLRDEIKESIADDIMDRAFGN